ncbi:WD40 repeat-like protein [Fusarium austroafricanum]|uniref:WD40 repeat-like protein n=1 Tax=Fusarium austroafricanum TaxID=2364996 RepID=A0A8H4NPU7_9HYPO|nr:WD40 repeat-like protein [Fusarium austroafricanum]
MASKDITLPADATDTMSSVRWSPVAHHLAAASWDGNVRVYDVKADGSASGVAILPADRPVFSCDWSKDGTIIAAAGADNQVRLLHAPTGQTAVVGAHSAPVRSISFLDIPSSPAPILASGSWDKTVQYWDLRQTGKPLATLQCADRVYSMDSAAHLLVIATAEKHIHLVNLRTDPTKFARSTTSPLNHQTKAVAACPDGEGWATASIEGRCGMNGMDDKDTRKRFTFKCHRDQPDARKVTKVYAVNDVRFHPKHQTTFSTAGSDGTFQFWEGTARQRLKAFPSVGGAITSIDFSHDGSLFAYAVGYDWSMGYTKNTTDYPNKLMLHPVVEDEVKPRGRK